jgi:catechol 2,3-dioxygenase-like lactoylglutathione lyase family enzyme
LRPVNAPAVDHLTPTVTDLERSQRFYCALLGLIRLVDFGPVLNLRDPEGIALEFVVPGPLLVAGHAELRSTTLSPEGIEARARELTAEAGALGP